MEIFVQKFGGSSLSSPENIKAVASRIVNTKKQGKGVVAVVSAGGDTTDELLRLARAINPSPPAREIDLLLASGEQVSSALVATAIDALGFEAISFSGTQVGIVTDGIHTRAKIVDINADHLVRELERGRIVIVAGFQGVTVDDDITTLGRGGSDLTAVAMAANLKAEICEIYTDVEGVYTADPRLAPEARLLGEIGYEEMLEMAATGSRVLQLRAVEYGRNQNIKIHVRSSFKDMPGTIVREVGEMEERPIISGVTHDVGEAKVTIFDVPDRPGIAATIFGTVAEADINVDMIVQNISRKGITDISFTVPKDDLSRAKKVMDRLVKEAKAGGCHYDENIAKVSIVGAGMKTHPGVAADMFRALAAENINIQMISTSPIKIGCVVDGSDLKKAVRVLHTKFNLGEEGLRGEGS